MTRLGHAAFVLTSLLGAYLLFLVQPLMAKQILPWFGGSPSIWSATLLFFQLGLVGGYAYAHVTRRLPMRVQATLHLALLVVAILVSPVAIPAWLKPVDASQPLIRVLGLLLYGVGAPYVLLSATAPLLQDWYARSQTGEQPYRLYVPSNIGSLTALVSYPFVIEPLLTVSGQSVGWKVALAGFVLLCGGCAWLAARAGVRPAAFVGQNPGAQEKRPAPTDVALWLALAGCGSALLLAVTNEISQDVAVVPMLWVVPLALYLATFIVCFADFYRRGFWSGLLAVSIIAALWALAPGSGTSLPVQSLALLALLSSGCMVCHGELFRARPHPAYLTQYYLALAVGGSLGGAAVALVAPRLFDTFAELPLVVAVIPLLVAVGVARDRAGRRGRQIPVLVWVTPVLVFTIMLGSTLRAVSRNTQTVALARDFYGVVRVIEDEPTDELAQRGLLHGRILHGAQFREPALRREVRTYYAEGSGPELAIRLHRRRHAGSSLRMGVVGLGVGTLAARGQPGDHIRFFELSPLVIEYAQRYFTFLEDSEATVEIVPGDARLSLERELAGAGSVGRYDLLFVDAFSGDSIPTHLLTEESFRLYRDALADDGALVVHVTNQHLDLGPVVRALAGLIGYSAVEIRQEADERRSIRENRWIVCASDPAFVAELVPFASREASGPAPVIWTDAFSPLLPVIKWQ